MNDPRPFFVRFSTKLREARFLSISLVLHLVLGMLLGGAILFKVAQSPEIFVAANTDGFMAESPEAAAPDEAPPEEFQEPAVAPTESAPMQASAITSLTNSSTAFEIKSNVPTQSMGSFMTAQPSGNLISSKGAGLTGAAPRVGSGFFGAPTASGAVGLIGTFYDLKQTKDRKPSGMTVAEYSEVVSDFIGNWGQSKLRKYFKAPTLLASSQLFTPNMSADLAPKAFGVEKDVQPSLWLAWYRARVSPPKSGVYHFVGAGDDILFVKLNGKMVLDRSWRLRADVKNAGEYDYGFSTIKGGFAKGPGMKLQGGEFYDIDILIGEQPGALFYACILVEEEGVTYEKDSRGNPVLPVFRVSDELPPNDPKLNYPPYMKGGPVWSVQAAKPLPGDSQ